MTGWQSDVFHQPFAPQLKGNRSSKSNIGQGDDLHKHMKTCILALAAVAAFTGAASADTGDLRLEVRSNPHGQNYYVYVRDPQPVTTVALYRSGREVSRYETRDIRVTETERPLRLRARENQHGQTTYVYTRSR